VSAEVGLGELGHVVAARAGLIDQPEAPDGDGLVSLARSQGG
jgi:hypothetical protein